MEKERHKTVAVVIENGGKIFLGRKAEGQSDQGKWVLPGGHVEDGEPVNVAAQREMQEEVGGVDSDSLEQVGRPFLHETDSPRQGHHEHVCSTFRATKTGEPAVDSREFADWAWFRPEDIRRLELADWTERVLKDLGFIKSG